MEFTGCHHRVFIFKEFWLFFTFSHTLMICSFFHEVIMTHCPHTHTLALKHTNKHTQTRLRWWTQEPAATCCGSTNQIWVSWGQAAALLQTFWMFWMLNVLDVVYWCCDAAEQLSAGLLERWRWFWTVLFTFLGLNCRLGFQTFSI